MQRFPVEPSALRIFRGYQRPDLPEERFLAELSEVFMPGTPFMLRDLGLAAYMPAVVPRGREPDVPDEVAVIAYASAEAYSRARNESLTGRLYTHTHRGVFDMARSGSMPPLALSGFASPVTSFALRGSLVDWQVDGDIVVLVGERVSPDNTSFGDESTKTLVAGARLLAARGVLECVGEIADSWLACWFLLDGFDVNAVERVKTLLGELALPVRQLLLEPASRLIWRDLAAPPPAEVRRGSAFSYVFERAGRHFLG